MDLKVVICLGGAAILLSGCPDGGGDGDEGAGDTGPSDESGTGGVLDVGGDGDGDCSVVPPLSTETVEVVGGEIAPVDFSCAVEFDAFGELQGTQQTLGYRIYRPGGPAWDDDDQTFPLVIFQPGEGQEGSHYAASMEALARAGAIVVVSENSPNAEVDRRAYWTSCIANYFAESWVDSNRISCDLFLAGHSRGGKAAHFVTQWLADDAGETDASRFELAGTIEVAPVTVRSGDVPYVGFDGGNVALEDVDAPAILSIDGTMDNDTQGGGPTNVEAFNPEEFGVEPANPKLSLWAYDVPHNAWGGISITEDEDLPFNGRAAISALEYRAKAEAILRTYIPQFVRSQLTPSRDLTPLLTLGEFPPAVDGEPPIDDSSWWNYMAENPDGDPMVFSAFTPGLRVGRSRVRIDTMARPAGSNPLESSAGFDLSVTAQLSLEFGLAGEIAFHSFTGPGRLTNAMRVDWSGPSGEVAWDVQGADLSEVTRLRVRVANLVDFVPATVPCTPISPVNRNLLFELGVRGDGEEYLVSFGGAETVFPVQDFGEVRFQGNTQICQSTPFLQTFEIDLTSVEACDALSPDSIEEVVFLVGDGAAPIGSVLVDSLEFIRDAEDQLCPGF